jgi:rubrerythrin
MKPNKVENQQVWEYELRRRLQSLEAEQQSIADKEKNRLKKLHWMRCPKCGQNLVTGHNGLVEIDVCPSCRGLWLDANELESIVASESGFLQSWLKILR